jgi:hypothetical protein
VALGRNGTEPTEFPFQHFQFEPCFSIVNDSQYIFKSVVWIRKKSPGRSSLLRYVGHSSRRNMRNGSISSCAWPGATLQFLKITGACKRKWMGSASMCTSFCPWIKTRTGCISLFPLITICYLVLSCKLCFSNSKSISRHHETDFLRTPL